MYEVFNLSSHQTEYVFHSRRDAEVICNLMNTEAIIEGHIDHYITRTYVAPTVAPEDVKALKESFRIPKTLYAECYVTMFSRDKYDVEVFVNDEQYYQESPVKEIEYHKWVVEFGFPRSKMKQERREIFLQLAEKAVKMVNANGMINTVRTSTGDDYKCKH